MIEDKITFRIDGELKEKLQKLADNDKRKLSDFIRLKLEALVKEKTGVDKEKLFAEKEARIKRIANKVNEW